MANSMDPDQTAPVGAVCSGSTLFASIINSSVMLGDHLQQKTSAENIFRCVFFSSRFKGYCKLWQNSVDSVHHISLNIHIHDSLYWQSKQGFFGGNC